MHHPLVTIAIPTYNAASFISATLDSISAQTYKNYEVLVVDDGSKDQTCEIIEKHGFPVLQLCQNSKNLGCVATIARCAELAKGEIIVFLCHDDILAPVALERMIEAFQDPEVGAVTRSYFWFQGNQVNQAIRFTSSIEEKILKMDARANYHQVGKLLETLGQLSGLGFRKRLMNVPFSPHVFTVHIQPFLGILRDHSVAYIGDYLVAVRTETSQSRSLPSIYQVSPLESWLIMIDFVFADVRFKTIRKNCRKVICTQNDVGLVQIKCSKGQEATLREIWFSLRAWPLNLIRPSFLFWSLVVLCMPASLLRMILDKLKAFIGPRLNPMIKLADHR